MKEQTFELKNAEESVGVISKDHFDMMVLSLSGFWGTLNARGGFGKIVNVDDFVGSIFGSSKMSATIPCINGMTVVFDNQRYAGVTEIRVYHSDAGLVFTQNVENVEDVTGRVIIPC